jgi:hypothetical protein
VSKSSDHTLSLHGLTSNSSSTTNFPWLILQTTDPILILLYSVVLRSTLFYSHSLDSRSSITILFRLLNSQFHFSNLISLAKSEFESYVTIDGESAGLSWNKAPNWGLRQDFYYYQTVVGLLMRGALCDERTGLSFTIVAGPRQRSHPWVRIPWDS